MKGKGILLVLWGAALFMAACGDDSSGKSSENTPDASAEDASVGQASPQESTSENSSGTSTSASGNGASSSPQPLTLPSGSSEAAEGDPVPDCTVSGSVNLPFDATFDDEKLHALVQDEKFLVEFGGWNSQTSGTSRTEQGDRKVHMSVRLTPSGKVSELNHHLENHQGNHNGTCETGELCGITAENAWDYAPWYKTANNNMQLISVSYTDRSTAGYLPGEKPEIQIKVTVCELLFEFENLGELSKDLLTLLAKQMGDDVLTKPETLDYSELQPVSLPAGTPVARPQLKLYAAGTLINHQVYYPVDAQFTWNLSTQLAQRSNPARQSCAFSFLRETTQTKLQKALDANLNAPLACGRFLSCQETGVNLIEAAQGLLCPVNAVEIPGVFSALSIQDSDRWYDAPMTSPLQETLTIYPVNTTAEAYKAHQDLFYSAEVAYLFQRSLHPMTTTGKYFTLTDSANRVYQADAIAGEILDLKTAQDTSQNTSFILRIHPDLPAGVTGTSPSPAGKFQGVRYRLESSRLVVRWGILVSSLSEVVVPDAIPETGITCDGKPYFCYDHDQNSLEQE